ncbi:Glutathione S-transferase domain protein, partial [Metarhizium majus ARSEF 297]
MAYTLYIGNKRYSSWSMRPWVLLKALDIPFDEKLQLFKPGQRQPDFLEFSPTGKVPCLYDAERKHVAIWDSLAICEYLAEKHPAAWPSDPVARAFARSAASEMHSSFAAIRDECSMNVALRIELGEPSEGLRRDLERLTALCSEGIQRFGGPFLAGNSFTVADAFYAPIASRVKTFGIRLDGAAGEYLDRLYEHPAVQAWIQEGIAEAEREPGHEEDCVRGRRILQDLCK